MPKLMLFAPCERVIVEEGSSTVSLISVVQGLTAAVPKDIDPKALAPQRWYVLTIWERENTDESRRFEQRVIVQDPQGVKALEMLAEFEVKKNFHRNITVIEGFPIAEVGRYSLLLSLRAVGEKEWRLLADYPIVLAHITPPG